ncbi:hypothetical protein IQ231_16620 [Cuspidothrix issatschenkoi LEGE 03284]|jgi:hypothetical protein|uniref:hypothetical protein n=1 Tax=Cuspidothrix issatschenkoi TaxID=230752 RepID=UPI00187F8D8D|nr:hypothetical protein [Cuspidothrix issatschenkoi]MBE9233249.1 hypothetical protein [Cuspidothrix issatschenkoi LEGE 03284]
MNTREVVVNKLQQLPDPLLSRVDEFLDFLIAQQQNQAVNVQSSESLTDRWKRWFEQVDQLSVLNHEPQPQNEYQQRLLEKYRQQGLEL